MTALEFLPRQVRWLVAPFWNEGIDFIDEGTRTKGDGTTERVERYMIMGKRRPVLVLRVWHGSRALVWLATTMTPRPGVKSSLLEFGGRKTSYLVHEARRLQSVNVAQTAFAWDEPTNMDERTTTFASLVKVALGLRLRQPRLELSPDTH